jgi:hypothetical protein
MAVSAATIAAVESMTLGEPVAVGPQAWCRKIGGDEASAAETETVV